MLVAHTLLVSKRVMKRFLLGFALALAGCSKVDIYQPQTQAAPPSDMPQVRQTAQERIVEIDRFLSTPLTGRQDDADLRATLRAERAALVGSGGSANNHQRPNVVTNNSMNFHQHEQSRQQQQQNDVPLVTIAHDTSHDQPRYSGGVEGMVPSERARYFKELHITNPNPVYGVAPVDHRDHPRR